MIVNIVRITQWHRGGVNLFSSVWREASRAQAHASLDFTVSCLFFFLFLTITSTHLWMLISSAQFYVTKQQQRKTDMTETKDLQTGKWWKLYALCVRVLQSHSVLFAPPLKHLLWTPERWHELKLKTSDAEQCVLIPGRHITTFYHACYPDAQGALWRRRSMC